MLAPLMQPYPFNCVSILQSKYLAQMQRTVEKKKLLDALRDERKVWQNK